MWDTFATELTHAGRVKMPLTFLQCRGLTWSHHFLVLSGLRRVCSIATAYNNFCSYCIVCHSREQEQLASHCVRKMPQFGSGGSDSVQEL